MPGGNPPCVCPTCTGVCITIGGTGNCDDYPDDPYMMERFCVEGSVSDTWTVGETYIGTTGKGVRVVWGKVYRNGILVVPQSMLQYYETSVDLLGAAKVLDCVNGPFETAPCPP